MTPEHERKTRRAGRARTTWERMGRGLAHLLSRPAPEPAAKKAPGGVPDLRVFDKRRELIIQLLCQDIDPRRVRIQLAGNLLTLSGAKQSEHRGTLEFTRKVILPATVEREHISARAQGHLLTVRLRKQGGVLNGPVIRRLGSPARVRDIMSDNVLSVAPEMPVSEAAGLLESFDIGSVPVSRRGKLIGVMTDRDIAIRVAAKGLDPTRVRVMDVMTPNPVTCSPEDTLTAAEQMMADAQVRRLPVVDRNRTLVGYLAMAKIVRNEHDRRAGKLLRGVSEPGSPKILPRPPASS